MQPFLSGGKFLVTGAISQGEPLVSTGQPDCRIILPQNGAIGLVLVTPHLDGCRLSLWSRPMFYYQILDSLNALVLWFLAGEYYTPRQPLSTHLFQ
jgi:hypothetical protein